MNIRAMRILDYYAGRLLCWMLSVAAVIRSAIRPVSRPSAPDRILFIKLLGMGSVLLSLPTVDAARKAFPDADLYFLTFRINRDVLEMTKIISPENVITIDTGSVSRMAITGFRAWRRCRSIRFDATIDLEFFSRATAAFAALINSGSISGFYSYHAEGLKRGTFIDHKVDYNHTLHTARAFFTLVKPLGVDRRLYRQALPQLSPPDDCHRRVRGWISSQNPACPVSKIRKWVVVNINTSGLIELRRWPDAHFCEVLSRLLAKEPDVGILFIGSPPERDRSERMIDSLRGLADTDRLVNLAGVTDIRGLIDIFHFSDYLISVDSGPAHLAATTPIHGTVLFGPETPELYAPLSDRLHTIYLKKDCQPCVSVYNGKHSHCLDNRCMQQIDPAHVLTLACNALRPSSSPQ